LVAGVGTNIDIASRAVASAQKPNGIHLQELGRRPESFSGGKPCGTAGESGG
jgi:hypothetical protein